MLPPTVASPLHGLGNTSNNTRKNNRCKQPQQASNKLTQDAHHHHQQQQRLTDTLSYDLDPQTSTNDNKLKAPNDTPWSDLAEAQGTRDLQNLFFGSQNNKLEAPTDPYSGRCSLHLTQNTFHLNVPSQKDTLNVKEEFLSKEALDVYYQCTLKAEFLGPHTLSSELKQLLVLMLQPDPKERLQSCSAALAHPLFQCPLSSDMTICQRTIERSLPSSVLRSPSEPAVTLVTQRV
ncbi:hypothetical protein PtA15_3A880 [Puccinia triticina]|uniref:Protein kinase domain-containing protein n=1 Tax=Puccinia triticina TaxID=208348 RepID=A0ABY7CEL4_9BASI|nr:uncharacterized protein PtA15_3A880 [Puccinia triticina]WAQ83509.1 hypothetical protein PtA15_3A880 [Puccinia triticina]